MTLKEFADVILGKLILGDGADDDAVVQGVCGVEDAKPGYVTYAEDSKWAAAAAQTSPLAIITKPSLVQHSGPSYIAIQNPRAAYAKAIELLRAPNAQPGSGMAPTARIDNTAEVPESSSIGEYVVIGAGSRIGERTVLCPGVCIGKRVTIGDDCWIGERAVICDDTVLESYVRVLPGAVIGSEGFGFVRDDRGVPKRIPHRGRVLIRTGAEIGANCVVARATAEGRWTEVGSHTKVDSLVQVAHNCKIGSRCLIAAQCGLAGSAELGDDVELGGQVGVSTKTRIGNNAVIGGQAGVFANIKDECHPHQWIGWPAEPREVAGGKVLMLRGLYGAWRKHARSLPCFRRECAASSGEEGRSQ